MKKFLTFILFAVLVVFTACELKDPTQPEITTITKDQLALNKVVFIGNSLTAGFQSGGLAEDFQVNSFPALIARQMGKSEHFEQPLIGNPGISSTPGVGVLDFNSATGAIAPRGTYTNPLALLKNATLARPYDNLGIPGANLNQGLNATGAASAGNNPFFDLILRNPNFANMTQVEQAKILNPTLVVAWLGNNDVLGAALAGGDLTRITPIANFQADYTKLIQELGKIRDGNVGIVLLNIPYVTDIPYVNILDGAIYKEPVPGIGLSPVPVVFDATSQPVDFDPGAGELYLPLITAETGSTIKHVLLPFIGEYRANGLGIPDSAAIANLLISLGTPQAVAAAQAQATVQGMIAQGLTPSGIPIPDSLTITAAEETALLQAVGGFNQIISGIAAAAGIPVVDANAKLTELNQSGIDGFSGRFVFLDPANTAFSLDGVHPNSAGYAIIANEIIKKLNSLSADISIPLVNADDFRGQYTGAQMSNFSVEAANQAKAIFVQ
ncbi:MAG: hypothetical protein KDH95_22475 [Calditrichaeota bacterium]|nr:hypothetical protein [Calditrichota bacterium]MCB0270942.1 hypothetical protein [Calditrichota bacterium]